MLRNARRAAELVLHGNLHVIPITCVPDFHNISSCACIYQKGSRSRPKSSLSKEEGRGLASKGQQKEI
jgi:hypothetical protein